MLVKGYNAGVITPGIHGSTYSSNRITMIVDNIVLSITLKKGFLNHIEEVSKYLKEKLLLLIEEFPEIISKIRGEWGRLIYRNRTLNFFIMIKLSAVS
ncbi:aminotransferase class III-fold pyridoxal phosphate-dependent enzyme [Wolbachia endosymbiont of Litomosoides sigmodontis]|uniref:aminotransferase class III-fold pyridoxal phosphate-dependent enzyme n=1 Tax=Wolbachia endosymbiont of Litomosoides sigmodontis TaxID=80850 RepID=UPI00158F51F8|nr:aminotransferase class III-fold pyridoxal phosphate-dependent enzyme [Wolbachia endosymbiont of Litomosoides sigmodontis]QKX02717.1 aminotransferase class III-fold pyridoxal phosphate-dependent enzyme [Wolbachia endosymbiont of Litomosoides sigmodontis]